MNKPNSCEWEFGFFFEYPALSVEGGTESLDSVCVFL